MRKNITYSFFFINLDGQTTYITVTIATNRPKAGQDCNKLIYVTFIFDGAKI